MNNYLKHYGVLGMKWGVRRYQPYPTKGGKKVKGPRVQRIEQERSEIAQKEGSKIVKQVYENQSSKAKEVRSSLMGMEEKLNSAERKLNAAQTTEDRNAAYKEFHKAQDEYLSEYSKRLTEKMDPVIKDLPKGVTWEYDTRGWSESDYPITRYLGDNTTVADLIIKYKGADITEESWYGYYELEHSEIKHHGVLGMKWGVRRYQDKQGNLTPAGKKRYLGKKTAAIQRDIDSMKTISKGVKSRDGKPVLTSDDVRTQIKALEEIKAKKQTAASKKWDKAVSRDRAKEQVMKNKQAVKDNKQTQKTKKLAAQESMRQKLLIKNYEGKTNTQHMLRGLGGLLLVNATSNVLYMVGQETTSSLLSTYGSIVVVGTTVGKMFNQSEYDRKYDK